ncbi:MAG TPA: DUF1329 domain-containing protein [Myxococcota bacterium]|nr:DUF1329 domain-containing protein [Myxococcota bacterium]HQK51396.1 DUF1329 domain-containing protein [Myxococcota bacterium]
MRQRMLLSGIGVLLALVPLAASAQWKPGVTLTADNWGAMVGFKPDTTGFKPGVVLDASNWKSHASFIPEALGLLFERYGLKAWTVPYKPIHPSKGYIEATNQYAGQARLLDTGDNPRKKGIENYTAGLPFPNPQDGLQVAWNYQYSYNGDDGGFHYGVYWINGKKGVERSEEWRWLYIIRAMFRTDVPPKPHIPEMAARGVQYTSMTWAIEPYDKAGFGALYSRYTDPKDQEGWVYIPTMRRTMKASFGTRGDAWNNTDMLYEDVRGFMGYPEWMHWRLVRKTTILAPMHAGIRAGKEYRDQTFDFKTPPYWNFRGKWEPRPVYVVEATPKFKDYPYSRMVFYFDAETFYIPFKEAYDKKGRLWKVLINAYNDSPDMDRYPPDIGTSLVIDLQAEHATAFPSYNSFANKGLDPSQFTLSNLQKMGK